jgi:hypothetical protein
MIPTQGFQRPMRRSSRTHVVFGVDFEEAPLFAFGKDRRKVLVFEACSSKPPIKGEKRRGAMAGPSDLFAPSMFLLRFLS